MNLRTGKEAAARVQGMLNPKYQVHAHSVDLTAKTLYAVDPTGRVDFGGSEYQPMSRVPLQGRRQNPEDRYPWWTVARGIYIVEFNETLELPEEEIATLEPEPRLLRTGATHPSVFLRGNISPVEILLEVHAVQLEIKQNARISCLRLFRLAESASPKAPSKRTPARPKKSR
jgi:deoxycytidine triphosphate deaminase